MTVKQNPRKSDRAYELYFWLDLTEVRHLIYLES